MKLNKEFTKKTKKIESAINLIHINEHKFAGKNTMQIYDVT